MGPAGLPAAFDRFLPSDTTWQDLFDVVIVSARKPRLSFATQGRYLPRSAWRSLPLRHLNVTGATVLVRHVPPENLVFWMSDDDEATGERTSNLVARETIKLVISPEVAERLDRRRILTDDLKQVILHAEAGGDKLFHPSSGRYKAAYAPYKVTFWVEYTPTGEGYVVHNAYAHRMEVIGP